MPKTEGNTSSGRWPTSPDRRGEGSDGEEWFGDRVLRQAGRGIGCALLNFTGAQHQAGGIAGLEFSKTKPARCWARAGFTGLKY